MRKLLVGCVVLVFAALVAFGQVAPPTQPLGYRCYMQINIFANKEAAVRAVWADFITALRAKGYTGDGPLTNPTPDKDQPKELWGSFSIPLDKGAANIGEGVLIVQEFTRKLYDAGAKIVSSTIQFYAQEMDRTRRILP